jgi:26S proteasome non-ATPase regulatory subunit 9
MGFLLPAPYSPKEQARTLMARKDGIEAELDAQLTILRANNSTLQSPLVDNQGFPRDDLGAEDCHFRCDSFQSSI